MKYLDLLVFLSFVFFFSACNSGKTEKGEALARVGNKFLYRSEITGSIPSGTSHSDSIKIAKNLIDIWVKEQVVLLKAESNLENDSMLSNINRQLESYKNSLVRFAYEKELVHQKLDTTISQTEIEEYYNNNKNNFELKDNIIKVIYLKVNKKTPKIARAKEWYKSESEKDRKSLADYCHQYAENFFLDDNTWLLFDDLLKEIPIRTYDKEQFLKNNRFIETEDSAYIYLVNIKGFKIKDSSSPLIFEKENIKNILLNKRKLKLIEEMEKSAYEEALKKNDIELFTSKTENNEK